jgi:hypothetical protein
MSYLSSGFVPVFPANFFATGIINPSKSALGMKIRISERIEYGSHVDQEHKSERLGLPESEEPAVPDYVRPAGQPGPDK